jgi:hypothetical protein
MQRSHPLVRTILLAWHRGHAPTTLLSPCAKHAFDPTTIASNTVAHRPMQERPLRAAIQFVQMHKAIAFKSNLRLQRRVLHLTCGGLDSVQDNLRGGHDAAWRFRVARQAAERIETP